MIILVIRTDKPEAEIGLYDNDKKLAHKGWAAHRQLAETLHASIKTLLTSQGKDWQAIEAIVVYEGPGSFTGLRIGMSVANALGYSYNIPVVGSAGDDWIAGGRAKLGQGQGKNNPVVPVYGADAHITQQRK
jgi:tRNA threonylcarbamoyladenosine biosynthesis protein TsaB